MKRAFVLFSFFCSAVFAQPKAQPACSKPLGTVNTYAAVYYAAKNLDELAKFDMVILDPASYDSSEISNLKSKGCIPMAYMNVGEVETYRAYFKMVDTSIIVSPDPYWKDRYYVDLCDPLWEGIITGERIPEVLKQGFCGVFLDFAGALTEYPDMDSCAVSLLRRVRKAVGSGYIIADGVRSVMEKVGNLVDGIAVEGLMGYYDFDTDQYLLRPDSAEDSYSGSLLAEAKKFKIKVFQLDYARSKDTVTRDKIIIRSRQLGFVPYVGTIELDTLFTDTIRKIKLPESAKKKPFPD